ncbi:zinc-ribbon domain-containing protein [Priestia megaterium]
MMNKLQLALKLKKLQLINADQLENIHSRDKVAVTCLNCNRFFEARVDHLLKGMGCARCVGNAKLTAEEVKEKYCEKGVFLELGSYVNSSTKATWSCIYGHQWTATPKSIQMGRKCPVCAGNKKHDYGTIKSIVEKEGHTLLSSIYLNARKPLNIKCNKGHVYKMSYQNFKKGSHCKVCSQLRGKK